MIIIDFVCDKCGRTYHYELKAGDRMPSILVKVADKDICYTCLKKVKEFLNAPTNRTE